MLFSALESSMAFLSSVPASVVERATINASPAAWAPAVA
jgi:hypothetical protein